MINVSRDFSVAFRLNYPEIPDSWFLIQFLCFIDRIDEVNKSVEQILKTLIETYQAKTEEINSFRGHSLTSCNLSLR